MIGTNTPKDSKTLQQTIQRMAQYWDDLLWISGSDLELKKCSFYLLKKKLVTLCLTHGLCGLQHSNYH